MQVVAIPCSLGKDDKGKKSVCVEYIDRVFKKYFLSSTGWTRGCGTHECSAPAVNTKLAFLISEVECENIQGWGNEN